MSMALWGTVIGALAGGIPCDLYGRKKTLIAIGGLYLVSALGSALAIDPYMFSFFRFIGGLGVGASSVAAPTYISEIAPAARRGRLVILYQFMIVLGILVAFISNWAVGDSFGDASWRWMLGLESAPAFIYLIMVFGIPNSPRWLAVYKKDYQAAKECLVLLDPMSRSSNILTEIEEHEGGTSSLDSVSSGDSFFSSRHKFPIYLAFSIALSNNSD